MISKDYIILDPHGMHARPATVLLKLGRQFKSSISLKKDDRQIQMKSMLNILALSAKCGDTVSVIVDGEDESAASSALDTFFNEEMKKF
jgi:phosphotransferase system HPr (HPr) family protein